MTEGKGTVHKTRVSLRVVLRSLGIAVLGLSALLFALPRSANATGTALTLAPGPSPFADDGITPASPDVQIAELSDTYQGGTISLTLETTDPTDPTMQGHSYFVNWGIWVNGDSDPTKLDFVAEFGNDGSGRTGAVVADGEDSPLCTPSATFADQQFSMAFPASCIGSPASIRVAAFTETLTPSDPDDESLDVAPNDSSSCCEATSSDSTSTSTSTSTSSTTSTSTSTSTTTTVPTSSTTSTSTSTTTTVPSSSTTTSTDPDGSTSSTTTSDPNASTNSTTTTTAPSGSTSSTTTTTTSPSTLASSTGDLGSGSSGGSSDLGSGSGGSSSGTGSMTSPVAASSLAFTGVDSSVVKWLLLFAGLLMIGGTLGRRWATQQLAPDNGSAQTGPQVGASRRGKKGWLSRPRSSALLLILATVVAATAGFYGTSHAGTIDHGAPSASTSPAIPTPAAALATRFSGHVHTSPQLQPTGSPASGKPTADVEESPNWSGYVVNAPENSPITDAQGSWTVPNVALSWTPTFSSAWVGIDGGLNDSDALAQTGTEQDSFFGFVDYSAWWSTADEDFFAIPIALDNDLQPFEVGPGDVMNAEVNQMSGGAVTFTLTDESGSQTAITPVDYQSSGLTAEWIMEAPSTLDQSDEFVALPLADYGSMVFDHLGLNQLNTSVRLTSDEEVLLVQNGDVASSPSAPSADGDAFAVAFGPTQPSPPANEGPIVEGPETRSQKHIPVVTPDELSILGGKFLSP
jgi:hypothetical protein